jgi:membrane-associated phospholipid phosphatase
MRVRVAAPMQISAVPHRFGLTIAGIVLVLSWIVASAMRTAVDYPVMRALNVYARVAPLVDTAIAWCTSAYLLSSALLLALIWYCWFDRRDADTRATLLGGTIAAFLSGMAGRVMQLTLPSHLRPMHDPVLAMRLPVSVDPQQLNHWNSFPSDHAAVQFGLAAVLYLVRPALGRWAFGWALLLNIGRVYLGVHFPTDITGGGALAVLLVLLAQTAPARRASGWLIGWERRAPAAAYGLAFFVSYQIATLFDEAREAAEGVAIVLRHLLGHGPP